MSVSRRSQWADESTRSCSHPGYPLLFPIQDMNRSSDDSGFSAEGSMGILRGFFAATTVLALVLPVRAASQVAAGVPQLIVDKVRHEFGEVFAGEDLMHVFWVRNIGTAPLELSETPLLGNRPSKVSFRQPLNELTTGPAPNTGRAAPS